MKALFVACQDPISRTWSPVGKLTKEDGEYFFVYTKGAAKLPGFRPFGRMTQLDGRYRSHALFPLFANRVLPKNRPEYHEYISWLALDGIERSEFDELARTGGRRATDAIELIPCPEPTASGEYETYFFCRGLRHLAEGSRDRVNDLKAGAPLYLMRDVQNAIDASALLLRTGEPVSIVGYTPAYFSSEFAAILDANGPGALSVSVERVNQEAPMQYRILCRLVTRWPDNFAPFSSEAFQDYSTEPMSNT